MFGKNVYIYFVLILKNLLHFDTSFLPVYFQKNTARRYWTEFVKYLVLLSSIPVNVFDVTDEPH